MRADDVKLAWGLVIRWSGSATFIEYHTYLVALVNFFFTGEEVKGNYIDSFISV